MATANVRELQKMPGIDITERTFSSSPANDEKTSDTLFTNEQYHAAAHRPSDAENIDAAQPAGVVEMEAITVVWTKNWLIAAYAS